MGTFLPPQKKYCNTSLRKTTPCTSGPMSVDEAKKVKAIVTTMTFVKRVRMRSEGWLF